MSYCYWAQTNQMDGVVFCGVNARDHFRELMT